MFDAFKTDHLPKSGPFRTIYCAFNIHLAACQRFKEIADEIPAQANKSAEFDFVEENNRVNKIYLYTAAHVFAAFAVEAALNYYLVSASDFDKDKYVEMKSWRDKLKQLAQYEGWSEEEHETTQVKLGEIFRFRNRMAHTRYSSMVEIVDMPREKWAGMVRRNQPTKDPKWFKLATKKKAEITIKYVTDFIERILPERTREFSRAGYVDMRKMLGLPPE